MAQATFLPGSSAQVACGASLCARSECQTRPHVLQRIPEQRVAYTSKPTTPQAARGRNLEARLHRAAQSA